MTEEIVCLFNIVELEAMRHQRSQVSTAVSDGSHQTPHPLLAARTEGRDDLVVSQAGRKGIRRDGQVT